MRAATRAGKVEAVFVILVNIPVHSIDFFPAAGGAAGRDGGPGGEALPVPALPGPGLAVRAQPARQAGAAGARGA